MSRGGIPRVIHLNMDILRNMGLAAILSLLLSFTPLVMAVAYVIRPTDHRLSLMRPLSLAGLFSALTGGVMGFINVLRGIGVTPQFSVDSYRRIAVGASESLVLAIAANVPVVAKGNVIDLPAI